MNDAIRQMLGCYRLETPDDNIRALRETLQELALLGLCRSCESKGLAASRIRGRMNLRGVAGLEG
jgi:hypothetical protein